MSERKVGCSDHNCVWGHPGGLGTNGGCKCLRHMSRIKEIDTERGIRALRAEVETKQDNYDTLLDEVMRLNGAREDDAKAYAKVRDLCTERDAEVERLKEAQENIGKASDEAADDYIQLQLDTVNTRRNLEVANDALTAEVERLKADTQSAYNEGWTAHEMLSLETDPGPEHHPGEDEG